MGGTKRLTLLRIRAQGNYNHYSVLWVVSKHHPWICWSLVYKMPLYMYSYVAMVGQATYAHH